MGQELLTLPFGKYKGRELSEIATTDPEYLEWLTAQGWFEKKFDYLFQTVITNNYYNESAETPDHNAMQVKFLEVDYLVGITHVVKTKDQCRQEFYDFRREQTSEIIEHIRMCREEIQYTIKSLGSDDPDEYFKTHSENHYLYGFALSLKSNKFREQLAIKKFRSIRAGLHSLTKVQFEVDGWDVIFGLGVMNKGSKYVIVKDRFLIECKPTLGDDYPAVLRQMAKQKTRYEHSDLFRGNNRHHICLVGEYTGRGAKWEQVQQIFDSKGFHLILEESIL